MVRKLDEYRDVKFYQRRGRADKNGFVSFDEDGEFYFCRYDQGKMALISQSYQAPSGRDNGIQSVLKNAKMPNRYRFDEREGGKHGFSLIAGNHQEIAVSVNYATRAAAEKAAGLMNGSIKPKPKKSASRPTKPAKSRTSAKSRSDEDNYQPLPFYIEATSGSDDGFETFRGKDGLHYFVFRENGKIAMVSEGYTTTAALKTGMASVEKNRPIEKRYDFRKGGLEDKPGFRLRAGNHREIARSIPYASAAAAATSAAYLMGTRKRAGAETGDGDGVVPAAAGGVAAIAASATVASAIAATDTDPVRDKVDDYLDCEAYKGHPVTDKDHHIALFTHENRQHYFVFYDADGDVRWRSEGFPTVVAREEELELAIKLHNRADNIKRLSRGDRYIDLLHADDGREIARSCLCTVVAAAAPISGAAAAGGVAVAGAALAGAAAASPPPVSDPVISEEPTATAYAEGGSWGWLKWLLLLLLVLLAIWLLSKCFGGNGTTPAGTEADPVIITCTDGSEATRLEDCPATSADRGSEDMTGASTSDVDPLNRDTVTAELSSGAETLTTGEEGTEVSPSSSALDVRPADVTVDPLFTCWDGSQVVNERACPIEPTVECWDGSMAIRQSDCPIDLRATCWDGSRVDSRSDCPAEPRPVDRASSRSADAQSDLYPWFAPEAGSDPRVITYLGSNVEFGDSHDLSPTEFYEKLADRYATNRYDQAYLDALFRAIGYEGGFADAEATLFSNAVVPAESEALLGFGQQHAIQHVLFRPRSDRDRQAFRIEAANGRTVWFMKTCGNYFYPL